MFGNAHAVARCTLCSFVVCGEPRWGGGCSNNTFHLGLECGNENIRMQAYWNAIVCWINVWLAAIVWGISRFSPSSNFVRKTLRRPRFYILCKAKISYYSDGCGVPHKEIKAERGGSSEFMKLIKLSCSAVMLCGLDWDALLLSEKITGVFIQWHARVWPQTGTKGGRLPAQTSSQTKHHTQPKVCHVCVFVTSEGHTNPALDSRHLC